MRHRGEVDRNLSTLTAFNNCTTIGSQSGEEKKQQGREQQGTHTKIKLQQTWQQRYW